MLCVFFLLTLVEVVVLFETTLLLIDFGKIPFNAFEKNIMAYPCILTNMWKIVEVFLLLHCDLFGFVWFQRIIFCLLLLLSSMFILKI